MNFIAYYFFGLKKFLFKKCTKRIDTTNTCFAFSYAIFLLKLPIIIKSNQIKICTFRKMIKTVSNINLIKYLNFNITQPVGVDHLIALLTPQCFQIPLTPRMFPVWDFVVGIFARKALLNMCRVLSTLNCQHL